MMSPKRAIIKEVVQANLLMAAHDQMTNLGSENLAA